MSRGKEALGKVKIMIAYNGVKYTSRGVDTDIVKASAIALINGINAIILESLAQKEECGEIKEA